MKQFNHHRMKHALLSILTFVGLIIQANAQAEPEPEPITYNSTEFGIIGSLTTISEVTAGLGDYDFEAAGENIIWDFTGNDEIPEIPSESQTTAEFISHNDTGYQREWCESQNPPLVDGANRKNCTNGYNAAFNLASRALEDIVIGQAISLTNVYNHYFKSTTEYALKMLGSQVVINLGEAPIDVEAVLEYSDPDEIYQFPITYTDGLAKPETTSEFGLNIELPAALGIPPISYTELGTRTNTVEGWGTLKLPIGGGTDFEVVKVKSVQVVETSGSVGETVLPSTTTTFVTYSWFANGFPVPIMEASGTINEITGVNITSVRYLDDERCYEPEAGFLPTAGNYDYELGGAEVTFINTSDNADTYLWDFGDGNTSTEENPVHLYECPSETGYTVTLTASNSCDQTLAPSEAERIIAVLDTENYLTSTIEGTICAGGSYVLPDGSTVFEDGEYEIGYTSSKGCDSTVVVILSVLGEGSSYEWIGTENSIWSNPNNWQIGCAPALPIAAESAVGITIKPSEGGHYPAISGHLILTSLVVEAGAELTVPNESSITVDGQLTVGFGNDELAAGNLTIEDGGSLTTNGPAVGQVTVKRSTTFNNSTGRYSIVGSPVVAATAEDLGSLVYSYDPETGYEELTPETPLLAGIGYFSAFTGDITFTGIPNNFDYTRPNLTDETYYLVSNPYPAAIDFDSFISANRLSIVGTIYLWDDGGSDQSQRTSADYITVNAIGLASGGAGRSGNWDGYIRAGQGFFVKTDAESPTISFEKTMRVTGDNDKAGYFRTVNDQSILRLTASTGDHIFNEVVIGLDEEATSGKDRLFDSPQIFPDEQKRFTSLIDGEPYIIQCLPKYFEESVSTVLEFIYPENAEMTLSVSEFENLGNYNVVVYDSVANKTVNLDLDASYTFSVIANEPKLLSVSFSNHEVLNVEEELSDEIIVYQNADGVNYLTFGAKKNLERASIYTLSGSLVRTIDFENGQINQAEGIDIGVLPRGLYILKAETPSTVYGSKFLIK